MPQIEYKVIKSRKLMGGISLSVHPEKGVVVRAPFWVPDMAIRNFVEERSGWIIKHLQKFQKQETPNKNYLEGEKHLYFGTEYPLIFSLLDIPKRTEIIFQNEVLNVNIYKGHLGDKRNEEIKDALLRFYLESGIGVITEKVNYYCSLIGVEYSRIDIKKVSSIWGSCSPTNNLCFNRKLIMAPHAVVDYVVIHEVCHMVHRNHSSRFWGLVYKFDPDYKKHRHWLHQNHMLLSI